MFIFIRLRNRDAIPISVIIYETENVGFRVFSGKNLYAFYKFLQET